MSTMAWTKLPISRKSISDPTLEFIDTPPPNSEEMRKLIYMNHEIEVKSYHDVPTRRVRPYRVTRVISPYQFCTEFDQKRSHGLYQDWHDSFNAFYSDPKKTEPYKIRTTHLFKFRCYAYNDKEGKRWERVRLFKHNIHTRLAEVLLCDLNEFRIVRMDSLMELSPQFSEWSSQGFPTHLVDIAPLGGGIEWPKDAVEHFKQLVKGKSWKTIVMTRSEIPLPEGFPGTMLHIGVVMIQRYPHGQITLQAQMVKDGFAKATGVCAGYTTMLDLPKCVPKFSFEDFQSASSDPEEFISKFNPTLMEPPGDEQIKKYFETAKEKIELIKKKAIENELVKNKQLQISPFSLSPKEAYEEEHFPKFFQERVAYVKLAHVVNPSWGYLQMQTRMETLHQMEAALGAMVDEWPHVPYTESRSGITIACLFQVEKDAEPSWVRAIVKAIVPNVQLLKVLLVDYGNELSVKYQFSRYLPKYFEKIPCFASRIHFDLTGLHPSSGRGWSSDASDTFRKYVMSWDNEIPLYYAWRPQASQAIRLEGFGQEVNYDTSTGTWLPGIIRDVSVNEVLNGLREEPMIASLFLSIGVEIKFEILVADGSQYQFEPLCDMLLDNGYAIRTQKKKTAQDVHDQLVQALRK